MTDWKRVREFGKVDQALELQVIDWLQWTDFSKPQEILGKPNYPALALELIAQRKSAYDALALRLKAAEAEVERLEYLLIAVAENTLEPDTKSRIANNMDASPNGWRFRKSELTREREITAVLREALETIEPVIKQVGDEWPESSADSSLANEYLGVTIIISEALAREKEMRKGDLKS